MRGERRELGEVSEDGLAPASCIMHHAAEGTLQQRKDRRSFRTRALPVVGVVGVLVVGVAVVVFVVLPALLLSGYRCCCSGM